MLDLLAAPAHSRPRLMPARRRELTFSKHSCCCSPSPVAALRSDPNIRCVLGEHACRIAWSRFQPRSANLITGTMGTFADPTFLSKEQRDVLRAYVTAEDSGIQNQADSTVRLHVSHSNLRQTKLQEIRLDKHMTVDAVKRKLISHTGTNPSAMVLQLFNDANGLVATLSDDARKLGFYSPLDGWRLHVIDTDPTSVSANGWLEDVSKVEKYMMSDADYEKRENTYRKFKQEKLKEDPTWTLQKELAQRRGVDVEASKPRAEGPDYMREEAAGMSVGMRCSCEPGDRRGLVRHVGPVEGLPPGWWVGVQYDEPLGKNDGTVKGRRVFECPPNHGGFLRPDKVKVGDYPPIDDLDSDFGDEPDEI